MQQTKTEKISLKDKIKFLRAKSIRENPSILENILGIPIKLKEFHGTWEDYGIFIKDSWGYAFLTREYNSEYKEGINSITISHLNPEDIIVNNKSFYIIKFAHGVSTAAYSEWDLNRDINNLIDVSLMEGFSRYDTILERCGIPKVRKAN